MPNRKLRVILDTNLWISFLITKALSKLDRPIQQRKIRLLFSEEALSEFLDVATRPEFEKYFAHSDIVEIFEYMDQYGSIIKVKSKINLCRDTKDNFWLELAKDSKADYLVTGDKDLLIIEKFGKTKILTFKDFIEELT